MKLGGGEDRRRGMHKENDRMRRTHKCQIFHRFGQDKRQACEDQNGLPVRELGRVR